MYTKGKRLHPKSQLRSGTIITERVGMSNLYNFICFEIGALFVTLTAMEFAT